MADKFATAMKCLGKSKKAFDATESDVAKSKHDQSVKEHQDSINKYQKALNDLKDAENEMNRKRDNRYAAKRAYNALL